MNIPNLLTGTKDWSGWVTYNSTAAGEYNGLSVLNTKAGADKYKELAQNKYSLKNDTVYTYSVWMKGSGSANLYVYPSVTARILYTEAGPSTSTASDTGAGRSLTSEWRRYYTVFRTKADVDLTNKNVLVRCLQNSELYACGAKLEEGQNLSPVWTPHSTEMSNKTFTYNIEENLNLFKDSEHWT